MLAISQSGHYLGTIELTQDLTPLRALQGERRLLQYESSTAINKPRQKLPKQLSSFVYYKELFPWQSLQRVI